MPWGPIAVEVAAAVAQKEDHRHQATASRIAVLSTEGLFIWFDNRCASTPTHLAASDLATEDESGFLLVYEWPSGTLLQALRLPAAAAPAFLFAGPHALLSTETPSHGLAARFAFDTRSEPANFDE